MITITDYANQVAEYITAEHAFQQLSIEEICSEKGHEIHVRLEELKSKVLDATNKILNPVKIPNSLT